MKGQESNQIDSVLAGQVIRANNQLQCYYHAMRTILPFAGVILALIAAASVAFIAWELTKEASREGEPDDK